MAAPGWATPELAEEWIEEGESGVEMSMASIVHEHGFAPGRASTIAEETEEEEEEEEGGWRDEFGDSEVEWPTAEDGDDGMSFTNAHQTVVVDKGTFVVHASLAPPRTPGKIKDFFTPLKLESMFDDAAAAAKHVEAGRVYVPGAVCDEHAVTVTACSGDTSEQAAAAGGGDDCRRRDTVKVVPVYVRHVHSGTPQRPCRFDCGRAEWKRESPG
ncbi:hypothetical protein BDZ89DRAFT_804551 [Hymenopellis radicata]|nr:hypothetical protein BDZ89DRAFT_804551 [Hymenopellis radicata]